MLHKDPVLQYRERLKEIFHQRRRGFDTVVRTQALKLLLKMNLGSDEVRDVFSETLDPWNTDYSLYVQSLIFDRARKNPTFRFAFCRRRENRGRIFADGRYVVRVKNVFVVIIELTVTV